MRTVAFGPNQTFVRLSRAASAARLADIRCLWIKCRLNEFIHQTESTFAINTERSGLRAFAMLTV